MRCVPVRAVICLGLSAAGACAWSAESAPAVGDIMTAVWRAQHVDFDYRGRTARYSCDGLRDKVHALVLELGARSDMQIVTLGCEAGERLRLVFSAPALPDKRAKLSGGDNSPTTARAS